MTDEELRPIYEETVILSLKNQKKWEGHLERMDEIFEKLEKLFDGYGERKNHWDGLPDEFYMVEIGGNKERKENE